MSLLRKALLPAVLCSALWPGVTLAQGPAAASDPKAVAIADQLLEALGGRQAWDNTHYLKFDWAVERGGNVIVRRSHTWDKWTGRYRLEQKSPQGETTVVLMNINTKDGAAYKAGAKLEGEDLKKALEQGYGAWVNDTYWLVMPYKWRDPGVILGYEGEEKDGDETYDKVTLSFDNVGLTPKDRYWAYVNKKTHLMDKWEYILKGGPGPATPFVWKGWQRYGKIMLAPEKVNPKEGNKILFPVIEAPETVADSVFTSP